MFPEEDVISTGHLEIPLTPSTISMMNLGNTHEKWQV